MYKFIGMIFSKQNEKGAKAIPLLLVLLCIFMSHAALSQPMSITYRSPQDEFDERNKYQLAILTLALEKTKGEYGEYDLVASGNMNNTRAIATLKSGKTENYILKLSFDNEYPEFMAYIPFPVDLGIVGNRVCFISPQAKSKLSPKPNLNELKRLKHVQGKNWVDSDILKYNGFMVDEVSNYVSKFHMVAKNRIDLYCRGINEIQHESQSFSYIKNLDFDRTFAFVYPLPRFFYTHSSNKMLIERVTKGLKQAYNDGSLVQIWLEFYRSSIDFSQIEKRKLFYLENPNIKSINFDYQQYFYDFNIKK